MYNRFSDLYDKLVFDIDYIKYSDNIFQILQKNGILEGKILEIGCGTGNLTQQLARKNYHILAFDNSIEMLNVAFPKLIELENVNLVMQDMYKFRYKDYSFDAVISLLDVINYISDEKKLEKLFADIYSGLREGGVFIFDLNSYDKLINVLGNNTFVYEKDNVFYTWENRLEDDLVHFNLNFFVEEDGMYERISETQVERYYEIDFIVELLEKIGFKNIKFIDEDGGKYTEKTQRILFSAKK
ncbi:MAG: class I SAM-dependent methyltransferase [Tissierellia bacterium]|nr:class I SAM-dependent methyltransferase [Tissierellia bacterium]